MADGERDPILKQMDKANAKRYAHAAGFKSASEHDRFLKQRDKEDALKEHEQSHWKKD